MAIHGGQHGPCIFAKRTIAKRIADGIKNANDIELKLKSYLHHRDYEVEELGTEKINQIIKNNETIYDMFGDKTSKKYGDDKRKKLEKYEFKNLPEYIQLNKNNLMDWFD